MAEISPREKVFLAYSPSALSNCQNRSSDVDFSDVFGGPPRRSSTTQEFNYSERSSWDFQCLDNDNDMEEDGSRWLKLREKPVFGEVSGLRRRFTSYDFFDDIFRGDQPSSSSQSPRIVPRPSMFASAPGSRVMSPSRSLPPAEPFAAPVKFSLPGRLTNTDFTASTSMNQSSFNLSLSRFNQPIHNQDGMRSSHLSNALRHQDTDGVDGSTSDAYLDGIEDQSDIISNAKVSEFPIYAANFHFSIYKWASKGVPLVISPRKRSPRSKEASKLDGISSGNAKGVGPYTPVVDALSSKENVRPSLPINELFNNSFISPTTVHAESVQDGTATARSNPTTVVNASNELDKACEEVSSYGLEDAKEAHNLRNKSSGSVVQKRNDPPMSLPKEKRSNTRPLRSFTNDDNEGNETVITKKAGVKEKEKPSSVNNVSSHKVDKSKVQKSSPATKKNDARTSEATGKVKDFVKIFNQESPSKASSPRLRQSHSRRWKEAKTVEVDYEIRFSSARMNDDMEASYVNWEEAWPDTLEMEDENPSGSRQFSVNDIGCVPDTARQTTPNAPNVDSQRDSATNTDAASDYNILSKDAIKGYETKVSQWSKGKEGNIRALLSTLQYVLWIDSGWKPVPLVDIIEANAVKRAYQKALLRLHPDKLQQKGAAPNHKLIAEKVFDILQEAWDQFNSLGSL